MEPFLSAHAFFNVASVDPRNLSSMRSVVICRAAAVPIVANITMAKEDLFIIMLFINIKYKKHYNCTQQYHRHCFNHLVFFFGFQKINNAKDAIYNQRHKHQACYNARYYKERTIVWNKIDAKQSA